MLFYYESMGTNVPRGVNNLDPMGMVGMINERDH